MYEKKQQGSGMSGICSYFLRGGNFDLLLPFQNI
jgi:hypothetical protein